MNRRAFIQSATTLAAAAAIAPASVAAEPKRVSWPIGCLNRPWMDKHNWGYDAALAGIQAAGYKVTGLLTRSAKEPLTGADATQEYLTGLKEKIAAHGLKANMAAMRNNEQAPLEDQIKLMRKQIDNAKFVGVEFLLTFGANKPEHYEDYYRLMHDAAAYAQERDLKLVLKPHGGASGAAEEIQRCVEKVNHPNFKIWFDAGNIVFYTGKDPIEQLKPIAAHVTGLCAKDCDRQGGSVWLEFGTGKVDFPGLFAELKRAGFAGPIMVECCAQAETPEAVTANARKNREYLEKVINHG